MKTKTLGFLTTAAIMLTAGAANANLLFDVYAGGTFGIGGYTLFADKNESFSSTTYGAVLGMDIPMFRIELEYNYLDTDAIKLNTGFVNGYFKLPTPVVKPYIGAGLGMNFSSKYESVNSGKIDIKDDLVYQGMLGITFDLPVIPFNIDIEGRVLYADSIFEYNTKDIDLLQYEGRVKLRYVF